MPTLYLSPSTQEYHPYIGGGNEEYYMNLVADAMVPYLHSSGIRFVRSNPSMNTAESIKQSNQGTFDVHVALHSNAASEDEAGMRQGCIVHYHPANEHSKRLAEITAENLKRIYPYEWMVKSIPTTSLDEIVKTKAPAVYIKCAYHDHEEDAAWIRQNISELAENVTLSLTDYFEIPLISPQPIRKGMVTVNSGWLNIRSRPDYTAPVIAKAWSRKPIWVYGEWQGWLIVNYHGTIGYADAQYIRLF